MKKPRDASLDVLGAERGLPSVNEARPFPVGRGLVVIAVAVCVALAAAFIAMSKTRKKAEVAEQAKAMQVSQSVPARAFSFPAPPPPPAPAAAPAPQAAPPAPPPAAIPASPAVPSIAAKAKPPEKPPAALDKSASALMAVLGNAREKRGGDAPARREAPNGNAQGALSHLLGGTATGTNRAGRLSDRNMLLAKGSFIECALQTRLDSTVPGMTSCIVTRDIFSDNGKTLLIERGSKVSGEYRANLRQGRARIFVLWTRLTTQNGVRVDLDSPGADALGGSGIPGAVDSHFWERFGGAILLTLIDDFARAVAQETGDGQTINLGSGGDSAQDVAAEALKNTINIPPTLYVNQGERIGIFVARDLDFGEVYELRAQ
ncbi:MAG: type IV secretion system protein VirB10 [Candidatus Accumulibacter sp.]|jgi:type IV secretion system protein VirB10|nr:type IV secretion system protein VirB10 [Accumulibacter sp.]